MTCNLTVANIMTGSGIMSLNNSASINQIYQICSLRVDWLLSYLRQYTTILEN